MHVDTSPRPMSVGGTYHTHRNGATRMSRALQTLSGDDARRNNMIRAVMPFVPQRHRESMMPDLFMRFAFQQLAGVEFHLDTLGPALLTFAMAGIMPNHALGHGYLVPYKKVITPIIGYKGYGMLMARATSKTGRVLLDLRTGVVTDADQFDAHRGVVDAVRCHAPASNLDPSTLDDVRFAYAHARYAVPVGSQVHEYDVVELIERGYIDAARGMSPTKRPDAPWNKWPKRMAQKTAIRRLAGSGRVQLDYLAGAVTVATDRAEAGDLRGYADVLKQAIDASGQRAPMGALHDGFEALESPSAMAEGRSEADQRVAAHCFQEYRKVEDEIVSVLMGRDVDASEARALYQRGAAAAKEYSQDHDRLDQAFKDALARAVESGE